MKSLLLALLPAGILLLFALPCVYLTLFIYERGKKGRRSPLTGMLLRSPGQSLLAQIDDLTDNINAELVGLILIPLGMFSVTVAQPYFGLEKPSLRSIVISALVAIAAMLYLARRLSRRLSQRNKMRLGYDAELAIGQELNQLMLHGCRVYHDFPAENFNIDHVVVGPGGVYAVETKGRAKPDKRRGKVDAKVVYDGQSLRFPDHLETKPLEQAKRQAEWLRKWLSSAVGEPVAVRPVLALPGWFIDSKKRGDVTIVNGKNMNFLADPIGRSETLPSQMIQRIAHQLEQRCRDVEPVAYRKEKKKAA